MAEIAARIRPGIMGNDQQGENRKPQRTMRVKTVIAEMVSSGAWTVCLRRRRRAPPEMPWQNIFGDLPAYAERANGDKHENDRKTRSTSSNAQISGTILRSFPTLRKSGRDLSAKPKRKACHWPQYAQDEILGVMALAEVE
jgi:hypothetical protein